MKLRNCEIRKEGIHSAIRRIAMRSIITFFNNSMTRSSAVLLLASCVLLLSNPELSFAQNISLSASTGKTSYLVGDYIHYKIEVVHEKNVEILAPFITDSLKTVSLIQAEKPVNTQQGGDISTTYGFILSGYDSAFVTIPPIPVAYRTAKDTTLRYAETNPVSFTISLVKINPTLGIKDVKSPFTIPLNWLWILLWIVVAIVIIGVVYYLYRRSKRRQAPQFLVETKLLPHEVAINALHELEKKKLWQKGLIKEYHSSITEIVRKYFEDRFGMPALEHTTSETIELLRKRPGSEPILELTYDFLSNADLVKFAKYVPFDSVNEDMMKQAYEIINRTFPSPAVNKKIETTSVP